MGIIFTKFSITGIDLSTYNDDPETDFYIDPKKVVATGVDFVAVRSSYGRVLDRTFQRFWAALKGFVLRIQYHYLDYYSHIALKLTESQWGTIQAQTIKDSTANDNDGCIVFIDVEKASIAQPIEVVLSTVQTITQACLLELDRLTGKLNGLYLSLSYLKYFLFAKHRPLWLAMYNENYTPDQAIALARKAGWTGPIYIWQYASDGDIDDDGLADGIKIGLESDFADLNIWVASEEEFKNFGKVTVTNPEPPVEQRPKTKTVQIGRTLVNGQSLRKGPSTSFATKDYLSAGKEVEILGFAKETSGNTWYRLGPDLWAAHIYNGKTFIEPITEVPT